MQWELYTTESLLPLCLGEEQSCLAQVLVWWICSVQSHAHPYSFQGLLNSRDHRAQVGLLFRNTWVLRVMYLNAPQRLNLKSLRRAYGPAGRPYVLHKVWWGESCPQQFHILFYLQEKSGLLNIILKAWGLWPAAEWRLSKHGACLYMFSDYHPAGAFFTLGIRELINLLSENFNLISNEISFLGRTWWA